METNMTALQAITQARGKHNKTLNIVTKTIKTIKTHMKTRKRFKDIKIFLPTPENHNANPSKPLRTQSLL